MHLVVVLFNGSDLKLQSFDTKKLVVSGSWFRRFINCTFVGLRFSCLRQWSNNCNLLNYDGDDDEIDLSFYGPKGMDYTIEVLVDGSVEYSHDVK